MGVENKLLTAAEVVLLSLLDLKAERFASEVRVAINNARDKANLPKMTEGTFYTMAERLCSAGFVSQSWGDELTGARRKFFLLTRKGFKAREANREYLITFLGDRS
jgi:DNA-binding PadR family transcriptional regulator